MDAWGLWKAFLFCEINKINQKLLALFVLAILIKRANMMKGIIKENSMPILNTWNELFRFFVEKQTPLSSFSYP